MGAADKEGEWHTMADAELELRAAELASQAHEGQVDKQGRNYFAYHLLPIAESLRPFGSLAYVAGLLHDIIEDTSDDLRGADRTRFPSLGRGGRTVGDPAGGRALR